MDEVPPRLIRERALDFIFFFLLLLFLFKLSLSLPPSLSLFLSSPLASLFFVFFFCFVFCFSSSLLCSHAHSSMLSFSLFLDLRYTRISPKIKVLLISSTWIVLPLSFFLFFLFFFFGFFCESNKENRIVQGRDHCCHLIQYYAVSISPVHVQNRHIAPCHSRQSNIRIMLDRKKEKKKTRKKQIRRNDIRVALIEKKKEKEIRFDFA